VTARRETLRGCADRASTSGKRCRTPRRHDDTYSVPSPHSVGGAKPFALTRILDTPRPARVGPGRQRDGDGAVRVSLAVPYPVRRRSTGSIHTGRGGHVAPARRASAPGKPGPRAASPVCPTPTPQVASIARVRVVRASAAQGGIRGPISARTKVQRCDATSTRSSSVSSPAPSYSTRPAPRGMDGVGSPRGARHPVSVPRPPARATRWSIHVS